MVAKILPPVILPDTETNPPVKLAALARVVAKTLLAMTLLVISTPSTVNTATLATPVTATEIFEFAATTTLLLPLTI